MRRSEAEGSRAGEAERTSEAKWPQGAAYEDKADAQQATRLKAARHFPQIRKHCSERTLAINYEPKRADACAPFGFGSAESALRFASAHFPAFPAP